MEGKKAGSGLKSFFIMLLVIAVVVLVIIISFKSCGKDISSGLLNLLPNETNSVIPDKMVIVQQMQQLGRLETCSVEIQGVFTGERNQDQLWGACGEKLVFMAYAKVTAGIDLESFANDSILVVNSQSVKIYLPQAEVFDIIIDNDQSYVVNRDTGFLANVDPDMETQVRQQAQKSLLQNAIDAGIIPAAEQNAKAVLGDFLKKFGFTDIEYLTTDPSVETKPIN